ERLLVLRVVDRDGRLIGEGLEQRDLRFGALPRRGASPGPDAAHLTPDPQGHGEAGDDTDLDIALAELAVELEAHVSPDVRAPHRTTLGGRPPPHVAPPPPHRPTSPTPGGGRSRLGALPWIRPPSAIAWSEPSGWSRRMAELC